MGLLITPEQTYKKIQNDFKKTYNEWKQNNNYDSFYIIDKSETYNLIKSYDYSLHTFFNNYDIDESKYNEIDQKKAYYNATIKENNKFYVGFPSGSFITFKVNNNFDMDKFNEITNNKLIGFFQVKIINHIKNNYTSDKLGFILNSVHTLTTPQIKYLSDYMQFEFINVSYCPSVDIPFNENFLKSFNKVSYYCLTFGLMLYESSTIETVIKPYDDDEKYYSIIDNNDKEMFKIDDGCLKIIETKKKSISYVHMAYFLNSYCKTFNLEVLYNNNIDYFFGVKVDALVYLKNKKIEYDENIFRPKTEIKLSFLTNEPNNQYNDLDFGLDIDDKHIFNIGNFSYFRPYIKESNIIECSKSFLESEQIITNRTILINGKGGSGKTYSILNSNLCISNIVYTTSCWNLIQGQRDKLKSDEKFIGLSYQRLLGIQIEQYKSRHIKYIVFDEATLTDKKIIEQMINYYYWAIIIIIGDIENHIFYQCSLPSIEVINPKNYNIQQIRYNKSYRFDNELNNKLDDLRIEMKKHYKKPDRNILIKNYVYQEFKQCLKKKDDIIFNNNDIGISGNDDLGEKTNNLSVYYINKGAKPQYYIKKTDINKGLLKGQRIEEKPINSDNYEMKLFKTIHSFQGLDLDNDNKIIIGIKCNFDYNLFYTALSRARRLDQINILIDV